MMAVNICRFLFVERCLSCWLVSFVWLSRFLMDSTVMYFVRPVRLANGSNEAHHLTGASLIRIPLTFLVQYPALPACLMRWQVLD